MAFFTSSEDWKADLASSSDSPLTPRRVVSVSKIDARVRAGMNAATTITSGKNDTKALPARATLRSTNSVSSMRSQTCQKIVFSAHVRPVSTRRRAAGDEPLGLCGRPGVVAHPLHPTTRPAPRGARPWRARPGSPLLRGSRGQAWPDD